MKRNIEAQNAYRLDNVLLWNMLHEINRPLTVYRRLIYNLLTS